MLESPWTLAGVLVISVIAYALTGGADYGGGVWDLLATGPRKREQRALIEDTLTPIWETNHIWLILCVVVLFSCFPRAFSAISTALHIPLTLFLFGVVARGSAFTFRAYDRRDGPSPRRWGLIFSVASIVAPILLGVVIGSLGSGAIAASAGPDGLLVIESGFFTPWTNHLMPWCVGILTLLLFAHLAAVYLCVEAPTPMLADDFRKRAGLSLLAVGLCGTLTLAVMRQEARELFDALVAIDRAWPLGLGVLCSAVTLISLHRRQYRMARIASAALVAAIIFGWTNAQAPYFLMGVLRLDDGAAPPHVLRAVLLVLLLGGPFLLAALIYLFRVFNRASRTPQS